MSRRKQSWADRQRGGAALVECAICLPVIFLLTFATLEICSAIFLKETATIAAFEGARLAIRHGTTEQEVIEYCHDLLSRRNVRDAIVTIHSPSPLAQASMFDPIEVRVTIPLDRSGLFVRQLFGGRSVAVQVTMLREFE